MFFLGVLEHMQAGWFQIYLIGVLFSFGVKAATSKNKGFNEPIYIIRGRGSKKSGVDDFKN